MRLIGRSIRRFGDLHPRTVLSDHEVELVRELRDMGLSYGEIARKMEISRSSVFDICSFRRRARIVRRW